MKKKIFRNKLLLYLLCLFLGLSIVTPSKIKVYAASNALPNRICIDYPINNSRVSDSSNQITVSGWSLNSSGVSKVQIYIDNAYVSDASVGQPRPDVDKVFPGYTGGGTSGYSSNIDISKLALGAHTITVKSIGNDNSITQANSTFYKLSAAATNAPSLICIDYPTANSNVASLNNQLTVSGWSLSGSGVQQVQFYFDGTFIENASIGQARPDVNKAIPGYLGGATSGYSGNINISSVSDGMHTITVKSISNVGTVVSLNRSVYIESSKTKPSLVCIDRPSNNSNVDTNQLTVSGWSLNVFGVTKVQIYIDNNYISDATIGQPRPDVNRVIPGYTGGATSGYFDNIDISNLANGTHTLTVKSTGADNTIAQSTVNFNKVPVNATNKPSLGCIDYPITDSNVIISNNQLNVSGWSLSGTGVQKVQLYLDNVYKADATLGIARPDVDKVFPGYVNGATSGYSGVIDISSVSDGIHTITVKSIANDGTTYTSNKTFNKISSSTMPSRICIDFPINNAQINNQISVAGWSLNIYGVSKVQMFVDNNYVSDATIGIARPDVNGVFPGYTNGVTSGYNGVINTTSLAAGVHTLTIKSIGNDGSVTTASKTFYKLPSNISALPNLLCVDSPTDGTFIQSQSGTTTVGGWALDVFGINSVQISLDGKAIGNATLGISRLDVNKVYPNYPNSATSGYSFTISNSSIGDGLHTITVSSIGNDGQISTISRKIYMFTGSNSTITNYNLSLQAMVNDQMALPANNGAPDEYDSNNNLVSADSSTVQYYLDPMNFMDSYGIYQFAKLNYTDGITADDLNKILAGKGVLDGTGATFLAAAKASNVSAIYLVSHALLETGNGTSQLSVGMVVNGVKVYNLFGIHAFNSNPNLYGSQYAYSQGWTSIDSAIYGGAAWISGDYINNSSYNQNTLYKMRWDPAAPGTHQYATDVRWAYNQVYYIKTLTEMCQNPVVQFDIPQYN